MINPKILYLSMKLSCAFKLQAFNQRLLELLFYVLYYLWIGHKLVPVQYIHVCVYVVCTALLPLAAHKLTHTHTHIYQELMGGS